MARHRRMVAPINSNKHYVHRTNSTVAGGAIQNNIVAESVVAPATANAFSVEEGSIIKAIHFELWIWQSFSTAAETQFVVIIEKIPGNGTPITVAQSLNLGAYPNKKNILWTSQGILAGKDSNSVPIIRDWILIPKGKQRMGLDDQIMASLAVVGPQMNVCGLFTYKEYR